eukprot:351628-Chlamydomonas_euryale.AAC.2
MACRAACLLCVNPASAEAMHGPHTSPATHQPRSPSPPTQTCTHARTAHWLLYGKQPACRLRQGRPMLGPRPVTLTLTGSVGHWGLTLTLTGSVGLWGLTLTLTDSVGLSRTQLDSVGLWGPEEEVLGMALPFAAGRPSWP